MKDPESCTQFIHSLPLSFKEQSATHRHFQLVIISTRSVSLEDGFVASGITFRATSVEYIKSNSLDAESELWPEVEESFPSLGSSSSLVSP